MRRNIAKWAGLFITALILQSSLVPVLSVYGTKPDLIMVVLFFFSMRYGIMAGIYTGFFIGLGMDVYSASFIGQNALTKTVFGALSGMFNTKVVPTGRILQLFLFTSFFFIHDGVFFMIEIYKNGLPFMVLLQEIAGSTIPRVIYTYLIIFLVFAYRFFNPSLDRI